MKILNLDKLASDTGRELVLKGKSYKVIELTVEGFIATTRAAVQMVLNDADIDVQTEATMDMIQLCVPGLPREDLAGLSLTQLSQITKFVRGDDVEGAEDEEGTPAGN